MPISTPTQITVPFATSGLKNAIPSTANPVTGNAGYDAGFPAINMTAKEAGGIPPFGQDFNGIIFDITTAIRYLEAGMQFPYSSSFATAVGGYPLGAIVTRTDGTGFWRNGVANNTTDPETFGSGWQPDGSGISSVAMSSANVTLTALQAATPIIAITGTLTANINLIFPAYKAQWLVVNNASGAFSVTCKTASGGGIAVATSTAQQLYGDGTNIARATSIPLFGTAALKDAQVSVGDFSTSYLALVGSGGVGGGSITYAGSIDSLSAGQLFSTGPSSTTLPTYAATNQGQGIYVHLNSNFGYMRWTEISTGISFERQKISGVWQAWGECYGQVSCDLTGSVFAFLTNAAPAGMIKANGAAVSRTVYARLFAKIGTLYGAGDGSTTFNVPDLRGEFIRGYSDGRTSVDVGRVMGSSQIGSLIGYDPTTVSPVTAGLHSTASDANTRIDLGLDVPESSSLYPNADIVTATASATFSVSSAAGVARPRNVALLYCIKF